MKTTTPWLKVRAAAKQADPVELLIYDQIGKDWYDNSGVDAKVFAQELSKIPKDRDILVIINSPGGNVWDGLSIYNQLQTRRNRVRVRVDGIAASIASIIAMAGTETTMPRGSLLMIHNPYGMAIGDAETMRDTADSLDKHKELLVGIYASKSGMDKGELSRLMDQETWLTGEEAVGMKLADVISEQQPILNSAFDLSRFQRVPGYVTGGATPPPAEDEKTEDTMKDIPKPAEAIPAPAPVPPHAAVDPAEFARVKAALETERLRRITGELNTIAAERDINPADWLDSVKQDESTLDRLRKLPTRGTAPVSGSVSNAGNALIEKFNGLKPGRERSLFMVENHARLAAEMIRTGRGPQNLQTIDSVLVPAYLSDGVINVLTDKLAMLNAFTMNFTLDRMRPKATVVVPKVTVGSTTMLNPTNFESGDSTVVGTSIAMNQVTNSFHLTNEQVNQGHQLMILSTAASNNLANQISDLITALMVVGTTAENGYGAGTGIDTAANYSPDDLAIIWALAGNYIEKNLLLSSAYVAKLIPVTQDNFRIGQAGAFGFDLIAEQNRWTGALANTIGFICDRTAVAVASGLPINQPANEFTSVQTTTLKNGLSVETRTWYARDTRTIWASHDVMFGAAVGDGTAGEMLLSSAPA